MCYSSISSSRHVKCKSSVSDIKVELDEVAVLDLISPHIRMHTLLVDEMEVTEILSSEDELEDGRDLATSDFESDISWGLDEDSAMSDFESDMSCG